MIINSIYNEYGVYKFELYRYKHSENGNCCRYDSGFYVPKEKHNRFSDVFHYDEEGKLKGAEGYFKETFQSPVTHLSGGGGLVSTMDNNKRFCMMLLNGGD